MDVDKGTLAAIAYFGRDAGLYATVLFVPIAFLAYSAQSS